MPYFSRRKSMSRSMRLCPPPRCRTVMRPEALRPLVRRLGESRLFSGVDFVMSSFATNVMYRRAGDVGLTERMAMALRSLHQLDLVPGPERHDRLLPAAAPALEAAHALPLALAGGRSHRRHLHVEHLLDRVANLHLVGVRRHLERDGVQVAFLLHALLGHQRANQHGARVLHDRSASSSAVIAARSHTTRSFRTTW